VDDLPLSIPTNPAPAPAPAPPDPHQKPRVALAAGLALLWGIFTLLASSPARSTPLRIPSSTGSSPSIPLPPRPAIQLALIAIDNIPPDKPWPWSRLDYSLALRSLIDYAPKASSSK